MSNKEINRAKNIAQFEELERRYENGHRTYGVHFTLRNVQHEEEFFETIKDFYKERLQWTNNVGNVYPKTISVTIQSRDYVSALQTPLSDDDYEF